MKIFALFPVLVAVCIANVCAYQPTIDKGDGIDGYVVGIDSFSTNTIISMSNSNQANNSDYIVKNTGSLSVWLDGVAAVVTTGGSGAGEGYEIESGESISVDGRVKAALYGRTAVAAGAGEISVLMTYTTR